MLPLKAGRFGQHLCRQLAGQTLSTTYVHMANRKACKACVRLSEAQASACLLKCLNFSPKSNKHLNDLIVVQVRCQNFRDVSSMLVNLVMLLALLFLGKEVLAGTAGGHVFVDRMAAYLGCVAAFVASKLLHCSPAHHNRMACFITLRSSELLYMAETSSRQQYSWSFLTVPLSFISCCVSTC